MRTITLTVASRDDVTRRALAAFEGKPQGAYHSFASLDLLWQTMTRKRWALLSAMTGQGAITLREAARRVGRDVKAVHGDMHALLAAGITERTDDGLFVFPFDQVHVDVQLKASFAPEIPDISQDREALRGLAE